MRIIDWSSDVCSSDLNALLFAVKRAASFDIHDNNIDHLVRWLLYCARRSATCLGFVAEHLSAISGTTSLPDDEIHAYILQQIPVKAASGHTHELAWLLFWAREIGLRSEEHTSELQYLLRLSYDDFRLKK